MVPPGESSDADASGTASRQSEPSARIAEVVAPASETGAGGRVVVWDLPVRVIHWGLVIAVGLAWASQELDGFPFWVHLWSGYTVLLLTATRIVWGFVGTRHARFSAFLRGPSAIGSYAKGLFGPRAQRFAGHNPLGALMVLALLAMLLAQAILGLFANDEIFDTGPLFGYVSEATSDRMTSLHSQLFDVLLAAIALHVAAALVYLWVKRENLILPMITGRKDSIHVSGTDRIESSRTLLALVIFALLAAALYALVTTAPEADLFGF